MEYLVSFTFIVNNTDFKLIGDNLHEVWNDPASNIGLHGIRLSKHSSTETEVKAVVKTAAKTPGEAAQRTIDYLKNAGYNIDPSVVEMMGIL